MRHESREFCYVLMDRVGRPKHVVEVGAYLPQDLVCLPFIHDVRCRIQLIEPNPDSAGALQAAFSDWSHIEVHPFAIAAQYGRLDLLVPRTRENHPAAAASAFLDNLPGSPYSSREKAGFREKLIRKEVIAVTFDRFDDGSIDGLVIDIEGAEWFVLQHMISRPAVISIEMEGPCAYRNPHFEEIEEWMETQGYELAGIEKVEGDHDPYATDYLYIRKDG